MRAALLLGALIGTAPMAAAQDSFSLHDDFVLEGEGGEFWESGVGSPTVVYDPEQRLYVMFFETRLSDADAECLWGSWGVGMAYSDNGIDGWQVWPDPIMEPGGDIYSSCVVAHPTALLEDGTYKVWFKAHQNESACDDGPLSWGCASMSGVGLGWGELNLRSSAKMREVLTEEISDAADRQAIGDAAYLETLGDYLNLTGKDGDLEEVWDTLRDIDKDWKDQLKDAGKEVKLTEKNLAKHLGLWPHNGNHTHEHSGNDNDNSGKSDLDKAIEHAIVLQGVLPTLLADLNAQPYDPEVQWLADQTQDLSDDTNAWLDGLLVTELEVSDANGKISEIDSGAYTQGVDWNMTSEPVLAVSGFGYPTVAKINGLYHMQIAKVPDIWQAISTDGLNWTMDPAPVMQPGVTVWAPDELFNPALVCSDADASAFPYQTFVGGRAKWRWKVLAGGWGKAISNNCADWPIAASPYFEFDGADLWRHWDVMRNGSQYRVYFSEKDASGKNRISVGYSDGSDWDAGTVSDRICQ